MSTAVGAAAPARGLRRIVTSTVGLKVIMALTGTVWILFLLGHMVGNLQIFAAPEKINAYAAMLHSLGGLLWLVRLFLLAVFVTHVWSAITLARANRAARTEDYSEKRWLKTSATSRYMMISGLVVFFFLAYHLAHFTLGVVHGAGAVRGEAWDVYAMVTQSFRQPLVAVLYVVANVCVGLHVWHAASSIFQTLGLRTPAYQPWIDRVGPALGGLILVGNCAMPLAIWLKIGPFAGL